MSRTIWPALKHNCDYQTKKAVRSPMSTRFSVPYGPERPVWSSMIGAVSMLYVFWEPFQSNAQWTEWFWTTLSFAAFLALAIVGAVYWSRPRVMAWACIAMVTLALTFTAYQPRGVLYFIYVAAYIPLAFRGRLFHALALVAATATTAFLQWWLLWPLAPMPFVVALEALIVGVAITLVVREQEGLRNALKTAEQERIARDLHDVLGHTLSVIVLKSELANRLAETDWTRATDEMREVESIARQALSEVRDAITGHSSGDLELEIDNAKAAFRAAEISFEEQRDELRVPKSIERTLSLALREAVTNVIRHAQATRCRLTLDEDGGVLRLQVSDNGKGISGPEGFGMRSMRKRLSDIGGSVEWRNDEGTELTVTIPSGSSARS